MGRIAPPDAKDRQTARWCRSVLVQLKQEAIIDQYKKDGMSPRQFAGSISTIQAFESNLGVRQK